MRMFYEHNWWITICQGKVVVIIAVMDGRQEFSSLFGRTYWLNGRSFFNGLQEWNRRDVVKQEWKPVRNLKCDLTNYRSELWKQVGVVLNKKSKCCEFWNESYDL